MDEVGSFRNGAFVTAAGGARWGGAGSTPTGLLASSLGGGWLRPSRGSPGRCSLTSLRALQLQVPLLPSGAWRCVAVRTLFDRDTPAGAGGSRFVEARRTLRNAWPWPGGAGRGLALFHFLFSRLKGSRPRPTLSDRDPSPAQQQPSRARNVARAAPLSPLCPLESSRVEQKLLAG